MKVELFTQKKHAPIIVGFSLKSKYTSPSYVRQEEICLIVKNLNIVMINSQSHDDIVTGIEIFLIQYRRFIKIISYAYELFQLLPHVHIPINILATRSYNTSQDIECLLKTRKIFEIIIQLGIRLNFMTTLMRKIKEKGSEGISTLKNKSQGQALVRKRRS